MGRTTAAAFCGLGLVGSRIHALTSACPGSIPHGDATWLDVAHGRPRLRCRVLAMMAREEDRCRIRNEPPGRPSFRSVRGSLRSPTLWVRRQRRFRNGDAGDF